MEELDELSSSVSSNVKNNGFITHVFKYDDNTKAEIFNLIQYAILAIIPIVLLNKVTQAYIPESDDTKPTFEISIEIVLQVVLLFVGMYFIHRIVTYIPTFSKVAYREINLLNITLCFMVIVLSLQTKLGLKVETLSDRFLDYMGLNGKEVVYQKQNTQQRDMYPQQQHQTNRGDNLGNYNTTTIDELPNQQRQVSFQEPVSTQPSMSAQMPASMPQQHQDQPNFDTMHQEPFAANDMLGGFTPF
tara:strand:+ start:3593 stop:4327 length:735 start_codon:yes stop_codon:yes gene_type:complete